MKRSKNKEKRMKEGVTLDMFGGRRKWSVRVTCHKDTVNLVSLACLFSGRTISTSTPNPILQLQPQPYNRTHGGISPRSRCFPDEYVYLTVD